MATFSKATANFVRHVDDNGSLIHVSRVNDSHKLVPMRLVVKRHRVWFWQRSKYQPTDFTLSDLLEGTTVLIPEVKEEDFLSYKETLGGKLHGTLETSAGYAGAILEGSGSSKLQSCFGKLKKEELVVAKLEQDSRNRKVNMKHVLMQQLEKRAEVLAVVEARIFTTNLCSITQTKTEHCTFQGVLGLLNMLGSSFKDSTNIEAESDVSMEIPAGTAVAYSVRELKIKKNGQFVICLRPGTKGDIESDSPATEPTYGFFDTVDGECNGQKGASQNGSHEMDFSPLAELPQNTRFHLFKTLQDTLKDRGALSYLQSMLEDLCCGENTYEDLCDSQRTFLLGALENYTEGSPVSLLKAVYLLVSAMEELPDETLSLLSESSPALLEAFDTLMSQLKDSSEHLSLQSLPVLLQDNQALERVKQLFRSTNMTLTSEKDELWMEMGDEAGVFPVVLSLSVQGLSLLGKDFEK